jgi:flagellar biosynthesis/type III secretory pathway M-ring protein FliF/YscJ
MKTGDIVYMVAVVIFAWITFAIIRGNFQRKFDAEGRRVDLIEKEENESEESRERNESGDSQEECRKKEGDERLGKDIRQ